MSTETLTAYEIWKRRRQKGTAKDGEAVSVPVTMMDAVPLPAGVRSASFPEELQDQLDRSQRARDERLSSQWQNLPPLGQEGDRAMTVDHIVNARRALRGADDNFQRLITKR